jgi:hypothetical protein
MKPVVAKMPVPTMFETTRAVALMNPNCRSSEDGCTTRWADVHARPPDSRFIVRRYANRIPVKVDR